MSCRNASLLSSGSVFVDCDVVVAAAALVAEVTWVIV
jgi:hypothetical protein